jgi:glycine cleavage system T protein (aminomethyltransferase)
VVATPSRAEVVESWLAEHGAGMRAYLTNCISGVAYLSVQGPRSRDVLSGLTDADLSNRALPYFRCTRATVCEVPMVVSRTGYSGELGYELYYPRDYASHVWDALSEAGATPAGLGALRSVRMEKRYPLYGLDVDETTTPLEAGLGWAVDVDKRTPFVGQGTLLAQRESGTERLLAGLELDDLSFVPAPGDPVRSAGGDELGTVTSADRGYALDKALALAYLPPKVVEAGDVVAIGEAGAPARVTSKAFYDPGGDRVRS